MQKSNATLYVVYVHFTLTMCVHSKPFLSTLGGHHWSRRTSNGRLRSTHYLKILAVLIFALKHASAKLCIFFFLFSLHAIITLIYISKRNDESKGIFFKISVRRFSTNIRKRLHNIDFWWENGWKLYVMNETLTQYIFNMNSTKQITRLLLN